ncbi:hypothetical protein SCUCBS95973_002012 [Sporothrix curviconia]|uniref:CFEM domain-containing protein n=1 Tax=Sporothrix curviconia TaxID=1260050 RepID=A0ABP0B3C8_9PEZI
MRLSSSLPAFFATPALAASLTDLIAAVPGCALGCLALVSVNLGCAATDLTCVCRSSTDASASLAAQVGACLLTGCSNNGTASASDDDLGAVESLAPQICAQASTAGTSVLSMVSTEIAEELSTAGIVSSTGGTEEKTAARMTTATTTTAATASGTEATSTPAAGAAPPAGARATMALLGIGGVAVLAVYAL